MSFFSWFKKCNNDVTMHCVLGVFCFLFFFFWLNLQDVEAPKAGIAPTPQ